MTPFDLINTERYRQSPFSVPCPHCGGTAAYNREKTKIYPSHASSVAVDYGGADRDVLKGTIFGECQCTNRDCQEFVHFVGYYDTDADYDGDPPTFLTRYKITCFFPSIPLIRIPSKAPAELRSLLQRSFAPAFMDQSASGNLLRSAIECLLTNLHVVRFITTKGKKRRLTLHDRILRIPPSLHEQQEKLLAIKWIGNYASHDTLDVEGLRLAFKIVENVLDDVYGTEKLDLMRSVKRINKRKKP